MTSPTQKRNRPRKPSWTFSGMTLDLWRSDTGLIAWAQTDPHFRDLLTVMTNSRARILTPLPGTSENFQCGRFTGYEEALSDLRKLAEGVEPTPPLPPEQEYPSEAAMQGATD